MICPPPTSTLFPYTTLFRSLVFVGPTADVMARMGDKVQAKAEMREADVPVVPGTEGTTTIDEARDAAEEARSEEHTSELQSRFDLVCRLLLEKKKKHSTTYY